MLQFLRLADKPTPRYHVQPYTQETASGITLQIITSTVCIAAGVMDGVAADCANDEHVAAAMLLEGTEVEDNVELAFWAYSGM